MLDTVRVAAVAIDSQPSQTSENLEKINTWAAQAAESGAQLVLFPELSLSGFIPNHPQGNHAQWLREALTIARQLSERVPGTAIDSLAEIAQRHQIIVVAGLLEDAGPLLFNTQVVVGPDGLLGRCRKMHIPMFETPFYNGGEAAQAIDTPIGRLGINICFDALLPESTRLLAVENVEIVLFPFAADPPPCTVEGWTAWAGPAIQARCAENGVFGIACNYVGHVACAGVEQTFPAGGMAVSPTGDIIADWPTPSGRPGMLLADFKAETLQAARAAPEFLFRFRRPELYGRLTE